MSTSTLRQALTSVSRRSGSIVLSPLASSPSSLVPSSSTSSALIPRYASTSSSSSSKKSKSTPTSNSASTTSPDWTLPFIHLGATHASRYGDHYHNTLASDILYMTYNHRIPSSSSSKEMTSSSSTSSLTQLPLTGYEINRPTPPPRGNRPIPPLTRPLTPNTIPRLESITLHTMVKESITSKHALLSVIMALRAISGETEAGGGRSGSTGVQIVRSRKGAAAFKLRAGMPVAAKVTLKGDAMYDFIQSLVDFVLPRIRDFPGVSLPPASASKTSPSALGGVVSFGLPSTAMALFPQIEANIDAYPKLHGFHMHFHTNARGKDAQEHARALLSGFRIPFHRR